MTTTATAACEKKARRVEMLGRIGLVAGLLIAGVLHFQTDPPSAPTASPPAAGDFHRPQASLARYTSSGFRVSGVKPIEEVQVGDRVLARNPEIEEAERADWPAPAWSEWLHLSLQMPLPPKDGEAAEPRVLEIELLRPESWVQQRLRFLTAAMSHARETAGDAVTVAAAEKERPKPPLVPLSPLRQTFRDLAITSAWLEASGVELVAVAVDLDLSEMGASGTAIITDIQPCPSVRSGDGQVVTATFAHPPSTQVLDVAFEGEPEPIGVTDNHLFWSVDQQQFMAIGEMDLGERVQTYHGDTKRIVSKLPRPGPQTVYNLEVYGEHVYHVGNAGLLAHNAYGTAPASAIFDSRINRWRDPSTGYFTKAPSGSAPKGAASRSLPVLDPSFTPNQATINRVTAFDFYRGTGGISADDALMHMRGIDFSKPVSVVDVPYGTTAQQLTYPGGMGNYFSTMGETATRLGIEQGQRVPILFQSMGPTKALRSTTSTFVWPSGPTPGAGGGIQFYIPNKRIFTPIAR